MAHHHHHPMRTLHHRTQRQALPRNRLLRAWETAKDGLALASTIALVVALTVGADGVRALF